ncbi:MAG: dienelactone hydrolase family protein [Bacteroidota bacterium]
MKPIKKKDIHPDVYELFDHYVHSKIDRREFLERISVYAVGGLTASAMFEFLAPKYDAIQIDADDPRLTSEFVLYDSPKGAGEMQGLLVKKTKKKGKLPGVVVVHENRGLNPHISDVARRAAMKGFLVIAPDALYPLGGYPGTDDEGRTLQRKRDRHEMLEDFIAAFEYLKNHPGCTGKVGVVGFCFGGWISNMMAARCPDLAAAVPFYGGQAPAEEVPNINAPLLLQYAELDERVNKGWPAYEAALKEHNKSYTAHMYPGVKHGFHNDTTPRYDKKAGKLAWKRTIRFFKAHLS